MKTKETQFGALCGIAAISFAGLIATMYRVQALSTIANTVAVFGVGLFIAYSITFAKRLYLSIMSFCGMVILNAIAAFGIGEDTWLHPNGEVNLTFITLWLAAVVIMFVGQIVIDILALNPKYKKYFE